MTIKNLNEKIKAYALKNAIAYDGKANSGAIISALFNEGLEKSEVKDVMPKIQKIIKDISKMNLEATSDNSNLSAACRFLFESTKITCGKPGVPPVRQTPLRCNLRLVQKPPD